MEAKKPTGYMERSELRVELAEEHGVSMDTTREVSTSALRSQVYWGRKRREAKWKREAKKIAQREFAESLEDVMAQDYESDLPETEDPGVHYLIDASVFDEEPEPDPEFDVSDPEGLDIDSLLDVFDEVPEASSGAIDSTLEEDHEVFDPEALFEEMLSARESDEAKNPPLFLGIPGIKDYVFNGHAGAGPSASERWMSCTMSLSASREFLETLTPNQQQAFASSSLAARQGTTAHAVGEAKANHMLGRIEDSELQSLLLDLANIPEEGEAYNDEMDDYVNEYVDLIKQYTDDRGPENVLIEERVEAVIPLSDAHEDEVYVIRGSIDAGFLPTEDDPVLVGMDLKYGEGIDVEVENNTQISIYLLGLLSTLVDEDGNLTVNVERVRMYVAQPRLGGIKKWEISLDDLLAWRDETLSPALTQALYGRSAGAVYKPSEAACQFCPARGGCPALAEKVMDESADLFQEIVDAEFHDGPGAFPETEMMSNERLGALASQVDNLVTLQKTLKAEVNRRMHRGAQVPGFVLVNYQPPRKWKEGAEEKIKAGKKIKAAQFRSLYTPRTLVSPTQAEKILGDSYSDIESLVMKPDKQPVAAPESSNRSRWTAMPPEAMFQDEGAQDAPEPKTAEEMFPDG